MSSLHFLRNLFLRKSDGSISSHLSKKPLLRQSLMVIYWLPIGMAFTHYFYTAKYVTGRSMQPTLNPDTSHWRDLVIFDRYCLWSGRKFRRGDVVALRDPTGTARMIVKRVIGLEGDIIKTLPPYPDADVRIPEGHVWVEGDEPFRTLDSNRLGPIPIALVNSRLSYIIWPPHRIGPLREPVVPDIPKGAPRGPEWYSQMAALERERKRHERVTTA